MRRALPTLAYLGMAAVVSAADLPKAPSLQIPPTAAGSPWMLNKWAQDFSLPVGIYRGNNAKVEVEKGCKITVEPGSLIEKVSFNSVGGAAWSVSGSFFRETSMSGDLGLRFTAVDTAFEGVEMKKGGGWFVDRWSTRWSFENCVFGGKFMMPHLGVTDYSVKAERCTFYKIELPALAYKDAASEAQSEELRFANCRFAGCTVPESFLAATVDCVFEECHFINKREDWSKSKGPINVTAYIVGANNPPANYENGNLKVVFKSGAQAAGAKILVNNSGGHLTMPGVRALGQPIAIGSVLAPAIAKVPSATPTPPTAPAAPAATFFGTPQTSGTGGSGAAEILRKYSNSLVFVNGTNGAGSGFIANIAGGNFLVTNAHVAAGVRGAAFKTLEGTQVQGGAASVAVAHDIFRMQLPPGGKPFEIMQGVEQNTAIDDEIVVLGNAEGAGVINTIRGKIVGIGPNLVEVDAPFVPGNSGSPIVHLKSGKVIGVATYLIIRKYDAATKEPVKEPVIRRFGYRLDSVREWQNVNWPSFYAQAMEMEKIEALTDDLGNFLGDLAKNHRVTPGAHTNPVIKGPIDAWTAERRRQLSPSDLASVNQNFIAALRIACQSDVTAARQRVTYDYFLRNLSEQQETRNQIAEIFNKIIKSN